MSTILITGATGFLGRHLVNTFAERGETLRVLTTSAAGAEGFRARGIEAIVGSVLDPAVLAQAVNGIDTICHAAGRVSRDPDHQRELFAVHVDGTRLLCEAAVRAGVRRLLLASTSGTIAITPDGNAIPDETWGPPIELIGRWPYYASKLYQEQTARRLCEGAVELVVLNPSLLLGPGDHRLSSTRDVLKFLAREIPAIPPGGLNFVDVRDIADAFHAALTRARPGQQYLLGGPNWSFEKFFGRLERMTKISGPRLKVNGRVLEWGGKALDALYRHWGKALPVDAVSLDMSRFFWYADSRKARRELGFVARDPAETLHDTVTFLREHFLGNGLFR